MLARAKQLFQGLSWTTLVVVVVVLVKMVLTMHAHETGNVPSRERPEADKKGLEHRLPGKWSFLPQAFEATPYTHILKTPNVGA